MVRHMILSAGLLVLAAPAAQVQTAGPDAIPGGHVVASTFVVSWHTAPDANQLVATCRLGYRVDFFGGRFFVEPSVAVIRWPVRTHVPGSFWTMAWWPSDFLFEPGLHFGVRF